MTLAPVGAAPLPAAGAVSPRAASPGAGFAQALEAHAGAPPPRRGAAASGPAPTPWGAALATVERAQARLDEVLAAARAGRTFTAGELLALQAQAYRSAQVVDLAAKLAEQGAQSVKQALNTQV